MMFEKATGVCGGSLVAIEVKHPRSCQAGEMGCPAGFDQVLEQLRIHAVKGQDQDPAGGRVATAAPTGHSRAAARRPLPRPAA